MIRVLCYIKKAQGHVFLSKIKRNMKVVEYSNDDWAGSPIDRRSTFGYYVSVGDNLASWKTFSDSKSVYL